MKYFHHRNAVVRTLLLLVCLIASASCSFSLDTVKEVAGGVSLLQRTNDNSAFPMLINVLSIDLNNPDLQIRAALGRDVIFTNDVYKGKENVASMVEHSKAVAGINADFFPMEWGGDPLGICIVNGELVSEPFGTRAAFGITKDNKAFFDIPYSSATIAGADGTTIKLDGINKPRSTGQLVAYTGAFGTAVQSKFALTYVRCSSEDLPVKANKPIKLTVVEVLPSALDIDIQPGNVILAGGGEPSKFLKDNVKAGDVLTMRFDIISRFDYDWTDVQQAVGGGPWLVKDGIEFMDAADEGFSGSLVTSANPRTALGLTEDNKLLMVTVDGRQDISKGMTLKDLAACMRRLGARNAINLDGGGSTTMSIRGFVVNSLSETTERYVANGLLVFNRSSESGYADGLAIGGLSDTITAGDFVHLTAVSAKDGSALPDSELSKVVWGAKSGMGFVDQMGRYAPTKTKTGDVCASYGPSVASRTISINAAPVDKIIARIVPDNLYQFRANLEITAKDRFGNPAPDRIIALNVIGGTSDNGTLMTDKNGKYVTGITWDANAATCKVDIQIDSSKITVRQVPIQ